MEKFILFAVNNRLSIIGMMLGLALGYAHWYYWGCYWGTYPLSSECWVNCLGGMLFGGFVGSLCSKDNNPGQT